MRMGTLVLVLHECGEERFIVLIAHIAGFNIPFPPIKDNAVEL